MTTTPCCNKCGDHQLAHGYEVAVCRNVICECHASPTQEVWEKIFDGRFVNFYDEEEDEVDVRSRLKHFIRETRQLAYKEGYEAGQNELPALVGEDGKLYSKVIAKCMEAPFPEVALQHAMRRVAEKYSAEARQSVLAELLGALPEPITLGKDIKISIEAYAKSWNDAIDKVRQIITNRLTKEK